MENTTEENAINDSLKRIHQMVMLVKHDKEVSLSFMKIFEREEMIRQQGRKEEQANTERERLRADFERKRADAEKERADHAEQEIRRLKEQLAVK